MDPIHYDKIADKLIQFHKKLPETAHLEYLGAQQQVKQMKQHIALLLQIIDRMAILDSNGWIK